jgi:lipopolysaccharide biosynthesis regulator YciM
VSKLQRVLASQEGQIQLLQRAHADAVHKLHASATAALDQGTMVGDKLSHVMQQLQHSQHHFATKEAHLQGALERANSSYVLESKLKRNARTAAQQKALCLLDRSRALRADLRYANDTSNTSSLVVHTFTFYFYASCDF